MTITEPKRLKTDMQSSENLSRSSNSPSVRVPPLSPPPQSRQSSRRLSLCSQIATHSSPIVFPEKRTKKPKAFSKCSEASITDDQTGNKSKREEHRIDIGGGDEKSDLLGYEVYSGKLILDKRKSVPDDNNNSTVEKDSSNDTTNEQAVAAKLTSKALVWGSHVLSLDDVVSVNISSLQ